MNKAIFKENIKRFWPVSFAAFIAYFMCGPFYVLQSRGDLSYGALSSAVSTGNVGYMFVTCAMTVVVGAVVYSYLFKGSSTVFMHAAPASRRELFMTSAGSGLALAFVPVLANALVLTAIKLSGMYDGYFRSGSEFRTAEMWNVKSIISWMIVVWIEIFFIFAICTLSAMISGNGVINVLTSMGLNLLTTLVYLSAQAYASTFLFGFSDGFLTDAMTRLHPVLNYGMNRVVFGNDEMIIGEWSVVIYTLVALGIFTASYWIYTNRANEKTGDSYVFNAVNVMICVLMVYMGSSCIGFIVEDSLRYWGFLLGGIFSFFVGQLIIQKSFRIFNRGLLVSLAASCAVMVLVIGCFAADIFGIEKYVPAEDEISFVKVYDSEIYGNTFEISSPENISRVVDYQKMIVDRKTQITAKQKVTAERPEESESWGWFQIDYYLKNGKVVRRHYSIPDSIRADSLSFDDLYSSEEIMGVFDSLISSEPADTQITVFLERYDWYGEPSPYASEYGQYFADKYNDYYGMYDLSDSEKSALMKAFYSDIIRLGLKEISPYDEPVYFNVEIRIAHPLEEYEELAEKSLGSSNEFHDFWYIYDENGIRNGVNEDFGFSVIPQYTETLQVIDEILANHFK